MELDFIHWLRSKVPAATDVPVGIGDDAAVIRIPFGQCVATTDMLMDGVDFDLSTADPRQIGRKALAVNLSDLAAMAARPVAALVSLAVPKQFDLSILQELYEGLLQFADLHGVALAGGDTNSWEHPLAISVTLLGEPTDRGVVRRDGARPGDVILVTGEFGGSLLGRHLDFAPRVSEALLLHSRYDLHAAMDVSDGLSLDLHRLAEASHCGALLNLATIPIAPAAVQLAQQDAAGRSPLEHALSDGEDFELILAVAPATAMRIVAEQPLDIPLTMIGTFVKEPGLWQLGADGHHLPLTPRGYEH